MHERPAKKHSPTAKTKEKAAADTLAAAQKTLKAKPTDAALKKKVDEADESGHRSDRGDENGDECPCVTWSCHRGG